MPFGDVSGSHATVVRVGPVEFDSEGRLGFTIAPRGFAGWVDPIGFRVTDIPRSGAPGSFALPVHPGTRLVTISGLCHARSPEELDRYGQQLAGLGADGKSVRVTARHAGRSMYADGYRAAGAEFDPMPALHRARYALDLWFPDPFKYGERRQSVSTGSSVSAFHYGNAEAWPSFEVTGFTSGYRILGPDGAEFRIDGSRAASAVDVIDFRTGLITRNGQPLTRASSRSGVWPVPAARSVSWRVTGSGSGRAVATVTDTWI